MRGLHLQSACLKLFSCIAILFFFTSAISQKSILVLDQDDVPLIGVECFNDDYSFATVSDENGQIEIPTQFQNSKISLKYLGFETLELTLSELENTLLRISLNPEQKILEEIILIGRNDIRQRDFLQKIDAIQAKEIASTNPQTTADALARYAEVYIQKSQMGGGSPVVRGFEANKVLLVIDGVRMNNAIYRNGHLQNAITVDKAILDQMEVIYGPSSLMYGSDALGGVIHFRTKEPVLNLSEYEKTKVFGNYYVRYASANQEKSAHFDINIGKRKWASLTSVSYTDYGDQRMGSRRTQQYPDYGKRNSYQVTNLNGDLGGVDAEDLVVQNENPNIQVGTAFNQFDILQKVRYQLSENMNLTANVQFSTSTDIPRYDQLVLPAGDGFEFAEWNYGPQDRALFSLKYKWTADKPWMDEMILIASRQNIEESRIDRAFGSPFRSTRVETVGINALTFDVNKKFVGERNQTIYYGLDLNQNFVNSVAKRTNINSLVEDQDLFTRYPSGGSTMNLLGAYAQYINESRDSSLVLHGGIRYSSFNTSLKYLNSDPIAWPSYFYDGINTQNSAFTWSAGVNWKPTNQWTIRLLSSTAFRAPNVDDIGKLRVNNNNITVPNPDLGAENSINAEINVSRDINRKLVISSSAFFTRLNGAIVRTDFALPDGSTVYNDGRRDYGIEGNVNADQAQILGISANVNWKIGNNVDLSSSLNYIRGRVLDEQESPLAHIPPLYGKTQLKYLYKHWDFTLLSVYNAKKDIEDYGGSADNPEYATPEGALGWTIYNIYANYQFQNATFQFGLENILDKHYLPFASGVSAPGINAIVAIRSSF